MTRALLRGGAGPHSPVLSLIVQREMGRVGAGSGALNQFSGEWENCGVWSAVSTGSSGR